MNMAKKFVIIDTLKANDGECKFLTLFEKADEVRTWIIYFRERRFSALKIHRVSASRLVATAAAL